MPRPVTIRLPTRRVALNRPVRLPSWSAVALPTVLMAVFGLWGIDRGSMYGTEEATYWAARLPLRQLFHLLSHVDVVHGLYYLLIKAVFALCGTGEVVMRLPSALGMTVAVALTAKLAQRLSGSSRVAVLAGLLMVATPFVDEYAQAGRSYAIDAAGVMASSLALLWTLDAPPEQRRTAWHRWATYAVLLAATGWLHEMTVLVIASHGVTLVVARTPRSTLRCWVIACLAAVVALVPLLILSQAQQGQLNWIRPTSLSNVTTLVRTLLGPAPTATAVMAALIMLGAITGMRQRAQRSAHGITLVSIALPLLVVPPGLLLIESLVAHPLYGGARYFVYCEGAVALLSGAAVDWLARRFPRGRTHRRGGHHAALAWTIGLVVVGAVLATQWQTQVLRRTPQGRPQDMGAAARFVNAHKRRGDAVLYYPDMYALTPLAYVHDFDGLANIATARSAEQSGTLYGIAEPWPAIRVALLAHPRVWLIGTLPASSHRGVIADELAVLHRRFRFRGVHRFHGVNVRLFLRRHPSARLP